MSNLSQLMTVKEACEETTLSRTAIFKLRERGEFPKAVSLGEKRIAFVRSEVIAWAKARIEARADA